MADALWVVIGLAGCAALYWIAYRIEPHYSSKDGRRFLTSGQFVDATGEPEGRFREFRGAVLDGGLVEISRRFRLQRATAAYRLLAKAPNVSRRRVVYLLQAADPRALGDQLMLRIPPHSATARLFDSMIDRHRDKRQA